jgi:hypothetical protein
LGLPALVGADKSDCFEHFIERIIQRINGWKENFLSIGGKEILLKAVAQAILVYAMSVFKIPIGICKIMTDAILQFWWGDDENSNKMHWIFGWLGGSYATQKMKVVWAFVISILSTLLCLQNKCGD